MLPGMLSCLCQGMACKGAVRAVSCVPSMPAAWCARGATPRPTVPPPLQPNAAHPFAQQVNKRYRALVWGRLDGRGRLTWELDGRHCNTEYLAVAHSTVDIASLCLASGSPSSSGDAGGAPMAGSPQEGRGGAERRAWVTTVDLWPHTGRRAMTRGWAACGRVQRACVARGGLASNPPACVARPRRARCRAP